MTLACLLLGNCGSEPTDPGPLYGAKPQAVPAYHVAIHPLYNPTRLMTAYQPLVDQLNAKLTGTRFVLEASMDYAAFERKYRARTPAFILPNPWQALQAMRVGYLVIATAGDADDFRGQIAVRADSGIAMPTDLKGKAVSYPSSTALAACIMPQFFLHTHGLDIGTDIENRYVGSQEASIMNVYLRQSAAGCIWPAAWRTFRKDHPEEASALRIAWETEPLINCAVMVRDDVPAAIREQVRTCLVGLNGTTAGKLALASMETTRFLPATDQDYAVVRAYVEWFEREVRPVEAR